MKKLRLKKWVIYSLYSLSFVAVLGTIYLLETMSVDKSFDDNTYVNDIIIEEEVPVVNTSEIIVKPFLSEDIKVVRNFYNYQGSEDEQKNALIHYDNTYIPNSGVDYQGKEAFDVVTILDGKVSKVMENNLLGKIIEITHDNNLISVYQSLGEVNVKEGDSVLQGQIIGKTGEANIALELGNHLHFELIHNGKNVNPEEYYDKQLDEL